MDDDEMTTASDKFSDGWGNLYNISAPRAHPSLSDKSQTLNETVSYEITRKKGGMRKGKFNERTTRECCAWAASPNSRR